MQKKSIAIFLSFAFCGLLVQAQHKNPKEPPPPPPPPKMETVKFDPPVIVKTRDNEDFYSRNPGVEKITWQTSQKVVLSFKDKTKKTEEYDLANEASEKEFLEKYGEAPMPPPPPPPSKRKLQ